MRSGIVVGALLAGLLAAPGAHAADRIDWRWRRFQTWEYAATVASLAGAFYLRFGTPPPEADWRGGILFDDWVRKRTALDDVHSRRVMVTTTDVLYAGAMGYRLIDSVFVPGVGWGNWDTALQMSMIDLEAFGFVAITLWTGQVLFGRQRPYGDRCPGYSEERCDPEAAELNRSFYAGHPAVAMTAAALTCSHHARLPLYGGGAADTLACGVTLGAAAFTGFGRVVTEMHYASDAVIGMGVGAFAGFALPEILHYSRPKPSLAKTSTRRPALDVRAAVVPLIADDRLGLAVGGLF